MDIQEMFLNLSVGSRLFLLSLAIFALALVGSRVIAKKESDPRYNWVDKQGFGCTTGTIFFGSMISLAGLILGGGIVVSLTIFYFLSFIFPELLS